jgi:hypothetical protein
MNVPHSIKLPVLSACTHFKYSAISCPASCCILCVLFSYTVCFEISKFCIQNDWCKLTLPVIWLLGASHNREKHLYASSCPPALLHVSLRLRLDGFTWNLMLGTYMKNLSWKSKFGETRAKVLDTSYYLVGVTVSCDINRHKIALLEWNYTRPLA